MKYNYIFAQFILNLHKNIDQSNKGTFGDKSANISDSFNIHNIKEDGRTWIDISKIKNFICTADTEKSLRIENLSLSNSIRSENPKSIACSSCHSQFFVKEAELRPDVYLYNNAEEASLSWRGSSIIVHHLSFTTFYYCGRSDCKSCVVELYKEENTKVLTLEKVTGFPCEKCRKITEKPHRCGGCEGKLYCSKDCKDSDWAVHKKMCQDYKKTGRKTFDANMRKDIIFLQKQAGIFLVPSMIRPSKRGTQETNKRGENIDEVD